MIVPIYAKVSFKRPLKDGNKIAGTYGENSFTSSYPSEEQIFLEETWVLNKEGRFERLVKIFFDFL
jgi:hypothetical protein